MNAPWLAFAFFVPTFSHQSSFALPRTRTHKRARASLVLRQSLCAFGPSNRINTHGETDCAWHSVASSPPTPGTAHMLSS
ncbi:hypothetical protein FKP32DRAFT_1590791 [Trametes sanguinea]|nr:hypothetical protein FKP32DRAFT_1590791 [Trametes sanguinea]